MTWRQHKLRTQPIFYPSRRKLQSNSWTWKRYCTRTWIFLLKSYCLPQLFGWFFTCCLWSSFADLDVFQQKFALSAAFPWCHRQIRPHVEPPFAHQLHLRVSWSHSLHLAPLELFPSLWLALSQRFFLYTHSSLIFQSKFSQWSILILCRHSSLRGFVNFPSRTSAAHPGQPSICLSMHVLQYL